MEKKKQKSKKNKEASITSKTPDAFSFNFEKTSTKKPQGIVFKKKAAKTKEIDKIDSISPKLSDKGSIAKVAFIKRKQRKDKLVAKETGKSDNKPVDKQSKNFSLFSDKNQNVYVDVCEGKSISEDVFTKVTTFADLGIHKFLVANLEKINFNLLTNVQEKSIPVLLQGKNALIRSQTGSGKTLAYAVPIMNSILSIEPRVKRTDGVRVLVVVPTRELALQTHDEFTKINSFQWLVIGHLCGGESRKTEKDRIRKGLSILIGTPGRLLDHALHTSALDLSNVGCLVLDEADRLLDMGFRKDIVSLVEKIDSAKAALDYNPLDIIKNQNKKIIFDEENVSILPDDKSKERQTILLSATLSKDITDLAEFTMKDHIFIDALDQTETSNASDFVIPKTVSQEFIITPTKQRLFTLCSIIIAKSKRDSKLFIFMASTHMVEFHYELFSRHLVNMPKRRGKQKNLHKTFKGENVIEFDEDSEESEVEEEIVVDVDFFKLHGNMDQKERKEVFVKFRKAKKGVLICTDVAARGLDVPEADCIIQYTPPQADKDYLHRIGRTGRAGKFGSAIIFLTFEEQEYVTHLNQHKVFLKQIDSKGFLSHLRDLMDEPNVEEAATALQRHFERCVSKNETLKKSACFAYSSWSRFYNSYSASLRHIFDFKRVNLGHYVTSFALTITPTEVSRVVRGQVEARPEKPKLNKKLANHEDNVELTSNNHQRKRKNVNITSEYSSGLEPSKKKKKQKMSVE